MSQTTTVVKINVIDNDIFNSSPPTKLIALVNYSCQMFQTTIRVTENLIEFWEFSS